VSANFRKNLECETALESVRYESRCSMNTDRRTDTTRLLVAICNCLENKREVLQYLAWCVLAHKSNTAQTSIRVRSHSLHCDSIHPLYVYGSVHHNIFYEITNRCSYMQSILFHCLVHSTCFGCFTHPSSGVQFITVPTATG
jgi:hypothetical protein